MSCCKCYTYSHPLIHNYMHAQEIVSLASYHLRERRYFLDQGHQATSTLHSNPFRCWGVVVGMGLLRGRCEKIREGHAFIIVGVEVDVTSYCYLLT